jgi:hypothetical protein
MARVRIGFVSSLSTEGAGSLHHASVVFTRELKPPAKWGRSTVKALGVKADCMRFLGTGVLVVWGLDEAAMAKLVLSTPDKFVVTVTRAKPKKDSPLVRAAARLTRSGYKIEHVVVKSKGDALAANLTPGVFELVGLSAPLHEHSAPAGPRAKAPEPEEPEPKPAAVALPKPTPAPPKPKPAPKVEPVVDGASER